MSTSRKLARSIVPNFSMIPPGYRPLGLPNQNGKHRAWLNLYFELLEDRRLLSNTTLNWFETFDDVTRVPLDSLHQVDQSLAPGVKGPVPLAAGEWITQLTESAAKSLRTFRNADSLLDEGSNAFTIIGGLGSEGLLLVRGQGMSQSEIEASLRGNEHVASFHLNQLIAGQATSPNESDFNSKQLGGLERINAVDAWDVTQGSISTVVGVIDTAST